MASGRVGIKAVAQLAGVSVTTVSHVLNDVPGKRVSDETRARVQEAATRLGYTPNVLARSLRTRRSGALGLVSDSIATTPFAGQLVLGAQEAASKQGCVLLLVDSGGDPGLEEREIQTLLDRQVDGLLYASMYHRAATLPSLVTAVPHVLLDARTDDPEVTSVVPDEVGGGRAATETLLAHGHRRIGFVTNEQDIPASRGRLEGYLAALRGAGLVEDRSLVVSAPPTPQGGFDAARTLLERPDRPSALFCFSDRMAMGAYHAAATLGLRIPHDLSVVGFDNLDVVVDGLFPALTTVALPHHAMGVWATEALLALIEDPSRPAEHAALACPVVSRGSVSHPSAAG